MTRLWHLCVFFGLLERYYKIQLDLITQYLLFTKFTTHWSVVWVMHSTISICQNWKNLLMKVYIVRQTDNLQKCLYLSLECTQVLGWVHKLKYKARKWGLCKRSNPGQKMHSLSFYLFPNMQKHPVDIPFCSNCILMCLFSSRSCDILTCTLCRGENAA